MRALINIMDALVSAVKRLRAELKLTQPEFAKRVGVSVRAVAYYEKDRDPSGEILQRLGSLAARHGRDDLAKVFSDAFRRELQDKTTPSTPEENAWVQALLLLLRHRSVRPISQQISKELVAALESLAESARKPSAKMNLPRVEEVLVELRYRTAPNAEQKIEELARARTRETGEPIERARGHIIHERPDLYEDYLDDRAAAAKGTSFERSMARGKRTRKALCATGRKDKPCRST
jgi:transcriptional regulator with XRE-family HTH domain